MPRNKFLQKKEKESSWLDTNLLLSLSLFLCNYLILGWSIADLAGNWATILREENTLVSLLIEQDLLTLIIKLSFLAVTVFLSLILTTPIALITFIFEESINSDLKAFIAILFWSILLVFMFCYFDFFANLLVIMSSNILLKLDLKKLKYRNWQVICFILLMAFLAFCTGFILFDFFS